MFDEELIYTNPKAALCINSKGRKKELPHIPYRTEYQRDIHRILYSQPFRRLRHKTQVFFLPNNDHICTRLEHSLHVASASRTVARHLGLNEDLAEAVGLAHDIGHTPFGHHGEKVLNDLAIKYNIKIAFNHEIHGLRVVDKVAEMDRYPEAGLNLTYEVRNGIVCHNGEDFSRIIKPSICDNEIDELQSLHEVPTPCTFEGCIVRVVDKITYAGRDIEDALVAGLIRESDIPKDVVDCLGDNNGKIVGVLLSDLIEYCKSNPDSVGLSEEKHFALKSLIEFNYKNIYKSAKVEKFKKQATYAVEQLFQRLVIDLQKTDRFKIKIDGLPDVNVYRELGRFINKINYTDDVSEELIVLDFIAGMTDNYVVQCLRDIYVPKSIT